MNKVKCKDCIYAKVDKYMSGYKWKAYECSNSYSDYYKCILNCTRGGYQLDNISWKGCEYGIKNKEVEDFENRRNKIR
jgi:hypothetical protein